MNVSIVVFPGTNCEVDVARAYAKVSGLQEPKNVHKIWHRDRDLKKPDVVIIPGGFSYGDYLRTGALAKISPVMQEVSAFAAKGGPVLGICNGFQILCESGLLPGVLLQNVQMKFLSRFLGVKVERSDTFFTQRFEVGAVGMWPVAHFEGNYFADKETLQKLEGEGQVIFRYCTPEGVVDANSRDANPNGAAHSIAGICNSKRNVVGLMPHPERAIEKGPGYVGGESGRGVFALEA